MAKTQKLPVSRKHLRHNRVHVFNRQNDLKICIRSVKPIVLSVLDLFSIKRIEVAIYFVNEKFITNLHKKFFNDATVTDCISFPLDEEILGEVFVCPKTALKYKKPYEEITLYVIHGLLHLLGFDDQTQGDRKIMRTLEKKCMNHCKTIISNIQPA